MRFIIAPLIALATCALPNISYTCESDSDCEAEHICEEGACVPPKDEPKTIINTSETSQAVQATSDKINDYSIKKLGSAKALASVGTVLWSSGFVLEVIGYSMYIMNKDIGGYLGGDNNGDMEPGMPLIITGVALEVTGPIFSAIGEKVAKIAIGQSDTRALANKNKMSGGAIYGLSWIFFGLAVANRMLPYDVNIVLGGMFSITSKIMQGVAAIGPLVRIGRYKKRHFSKNVYFSPFAPTNKGIGLSMNGIF